MGGLVVGTAVIILYCYFRKTRLAVIADAFTLPAAAGIILLKLGCFFNGCCFGKPTDGPFGLVFPANEFRYEFLNSLQVIKAKSPVVHPTQLYEITGALAALAIAVLLTSFLKLKEGSKAAIFSAAFCIARWIVLPFRELPYEKHVISIVYPALYAALVFLSLGYLLYVNHHNQKEI